ncbi:type II toxin-antitoxin system PemK/MazF family toxin [Arthrobacter sp. RCC_34]|uniref:type II toxin-antitoxin system PemK/MazF family toxin n=1 Tax=Arthrobacter sp. RCC_34 TaxID=3239230 RepID=UPI0035249498
MAGFFSRILRLLGATPRRAPGVRRAAPAGYPGDYPGVVAVRYSPRADERADPGEIVWTWVPYEEDHRQGKDRPVLLVGEDGPWLLGLMLTSKDRNNGTHRDAAYVDIGSGPWDREGRPSEVKVNRVVRVNPAAIRREGAVLDRRRFAQVSEGLRRAGH